MEYNFTHVEQTTYRPFRILLLMYMLTVTMAFHDVIFETIRFYIGVPHVFCLLFCIINIRKTPLAMSKPLFVLMLIYYAILALLNFLGMMIDGGNGYLLLGGAFFHMFLLCFFQCLLLLKGIFYKPAY